MTQPILNLRPGSAPAMVDKKRGRGRRARQLPPPTMLEACALPARHKRYIYFLHVHRTMDEEERLRTMYTDKHGKDLDLTIGRPPGDSDVVVKSKKQWDAKRHVDRRPLSQQQADGTEAVLDRLLGRESTPGGGSKYSSPPPSPAKLVSAGGTRFDRLAPGVSFNETVSSVEFAAMQRDLDSAGD